MAKQRFHIHQLSRLAFAQVTDWNRILQELEEGRKQMFWSYKPLRAGAFNLLKGHGKQREEIYGGVAALAEKAGGARCAKANVKALETFEDQFLPVIKAPRENYMESAQRGVDFAGAELVGGPHFSITDGTGQTRFVYVHPSKWAHDQTEAFCELLTVIIEKKFQASASDLWFLDLRRGSRALWPKSKPRVRRKCEQTAKLLALLRGVNLEADGEDT
jgi:hypothetical protein